MSLIHAWIVAIVFSSFVRTLIAMTTIGYARVSTDGQTLDAQHAALREAGCEKVYAEKVSGAKTDRAQLAKAIAALAEGDTLVVCKLDPLARSTRDLLNTLDAIAKAGATFKSLGDPWCDTTTPTGRLMLPVLGGLAEFERHLILARTTEGRKRAQARGVKFGRKSSSLRINNERHWSVELGAKPWLISRELRREPFDYIKARRRWWAMRRYCALISTNAELDVAALGQLSGVTTAPRRPAQKPK